MRRHTCNLDIGAGLDAPRVGADAVLLGRSGLDLMGASEWVVLGKCARARKAARRRRRHVATLLLLRLRLRLLLLLLLRTLKATGVEFGLEMRRICEISSTEKGPVSRQNRPPAQHPPAAASPPLRPRLPTPKGELAGVDLDRHGGLSGSEKAGGCEEREDRRHWRLGCLVSGRVAAAGSVSSMSRCGPPRVSARRWVVVWGVVKGFGGEAPGRWD
jgi:hypothetical protein